ncbi:MAG: dephospho-CoA kinase [Ruminococcaceae bacterium]|nr:dephospho-CoA kinase [Oscillospiraceae bacterium]
MSIIIGLTGPTGSGKSSAGSLAKDFGLKLIDCDKIARQAVEKGSDGLLALTNAFGKDILQTDGSLNRKALANVAFSTRENTQLLNDTIFPFIRTLVLNQTKSGNILLDAPTLFESGIDKICNKTVAVLSNKKNRLSRITIRDNLTEEEALLRMSAGKNDDFYLKNADYVIYNNDTTEQFLGEFKQVLQQILKSGENL